MFLNTKLKKYFFSITIFILLHRPKAKIFGKIFGKLLENILLRTKNVYFVFLPHFDVSHAKATGEKMKILILTSEKWIKVAVNLKLC